MKRKVERPGSDLQQLLKKVASKVLKKKNVERPGSDLQQLLKKVASKFF